MPILHVKGYLPGTGAKSDIVVNTKRVSFIIPCPGCNLVQIHCSGSYFETDERGTNLILNAIDDGGSDLQDIKSLAGYENIIDWPE
jgi:hypothetical protein